MRNDICIYVSSPYSYKDIFDVYYQAYKKFAFKSSIPLILSTNYDAEYEGIRIISSGDINDSWVSRSIDALKQIDSKYILLMCDDIFLTSDLSDSNIYHIVDVMDNYNINFCRLSPKKKGYRIIGENYIIRESRTAPYAKNLQIGIFNREYLLGILGDGTLSAWDIEERWLKEAHLSKDIPFDDVICVCKPIIKYVHAVYKGKLYPKAIKTIKQLGLHINTNREIMTKKREYMLFLRGFIGTRLSPKFRYSLKRIFTKLGMEFTTIH